MRWFNPEWFRRNRISIDRQINFWSEVLWWLTPENARIKVHKDKAVFWTINKNGTFDKAHEIKISKTGKWDIPPSKAIKMPTAWALAFRMEYLQFPKLWKRISQTKVYKWKYGRMEFVWKEGDYAVKFRDMYGNHVKVPLPFFTVEILDTIDKIRKKKILEMPQN